MFVKVVCFRLRPGCHCVQTQCSSTYNFIKKLSNKVQASARNPQTQTTNTQSQPAFSHHNVLAKQIVQTNDRLSVQRVRMQPFQRVTNPNALYSHLGLKPEANLKDIKSAYYYLAKLYHPDAKSSKDSVARQKFLQISEAYEVLSDDKRRLEYDKKQVEISRLGAKGLGGAEREDTFNQKPVVTQEANTRENYNLFFLIFLYEFC